MSTVDLDYHHQSFGGWSIARFNVSSHVDAYGRLRRPRWSSRWHVVQYWVTVRFQSWPPELGTPYLTTSRQRLPSHHSALRWRRICFLGLSDTDNMRHTDSVTWYWRACNTLILSYNDGDWYYCVILTSSFHSGFGYLKESYISYCAGWAKK